MSSNEQHAPITSFSMISGLMQPSSHVYPKTGIGIGGSMVVGILGDDQTTEIRSCPLLEKYSAQAGQQDLNQKVAVQAQTPLSEVGNISVSASPTDQVIGANSVGTGTPQKQQGQQF